MKRCRTCGEEKILPEFDDLVELKGHCWDCLTNAMRARAGLEQVPAEDFEEWMVGEGAA